MADKKIKLSALESLMPNIPEEEIKPEIRKTNKPPGRRKKKNKAEQKIISLYPNEIKAIEKYATDQDKSDSEIIRIAIKKLIPSRYFEDEAPTM